MISFGFNILIQELNFCEQRPDFGHLQRLSFIHFPIAAEDKHFSNSLFADELGNACLSRLLLSGQGAYGGPCGALLAIRLFRLLFSSVLPCELDEALL